MANPPVSRFAPSPSGLLHLGNARTALFAWLYARHRGGRFLVRVEDTDASRSRPEHVAALLEDLAWLGLDFDAGPGREDARGPYHQSARAPVYAAAYAALESAGHTYPCFCTSVELDLERRRQAARGEPPRYGGRCRDLDAAARARLVEEGRTPTLRFRVPGGRTVAYVDLVRGPQAFLSDALGDFIVRRADGTAAFLFANAVDDAAMGVDTVLRGEDHVANTPRQRLLLEALGLAVPDYGHLPLLVGADGAPLAKRHGATSVAELRAEGYLPGAVLNLLYRLGHAPATDAYQAREGLVAGFRPDHLGRSPSRFDPGQLRHWQKEAVHHAPTEALMPWVPARVPAGAAGRFLAVVRANLTLPEDAERLAGMIYDADPAPPDAKVEAAIRAGDAATYAAALAALDGEGDWAAIVAAVRAATGRSGRQLFPPLRAALTRALEGPELAPLLEIMPREIARARLAAAMALCSDRPAA